MLHSWSIFYVTKRREMLRVRELLTVSARSPRRTFKPTLYQRPQVGRLLAPYFYHYVVESTDIFFTF